MKELTEHIQKIISLPGLSGHEKPVRDVIAAAWQPYVDEIKTSRLGSLHAYRKGTGAGPHPKILLSAHMDAIGLMVTTISGEFLRVMPVGGLDPRILPGQPVLIHGREEISGIVVQPPDSILPKTITDKPVPIEYLFVDSGLTPQETAELVHPGDLVSFAQKPLELGEKCVSGHSLDNRASVAAFTWCLRELKNVQTAWDAWFVASVQEEVTLGGAITSPFQIDPDIAAVVDVTFAEGPGVRDDYRAFSLGKGIALGNGPNLHPFLFRTIKELAENLDIPFHVDITPGHSGTDAIGIQVARQGIPTMLLGIPLRYMHTPVEVVSMKDITRVGRLLAEFLRRTGADLLADLKWEDQ